MFGCGIFASWQVSERRFRWRLASEDSGEINEVNLHDTLHPGNLL